MAAATSHPISSNGDNITTINKEHLNIVCIGHVDSGKSTLSGQILLLSGYIDDRTIEKYSKEAKSLKRESWFLAFIMDTSKEERSKGKTVEVGRAEFSTNNRRFTILDAPGHKSYVPNMIQGASQADVGILVISARKGEFEAGFDKGGQTREHALLTKTLGVRILVVVINKMDEETVQWNKDRYDEIREKLEPFLKSSGFNTKKHVHWVPISAYSGDNVKEEVTTDICSWYNGPSLFGILDTLRVGGRKPDAPLRIPVLDRFNDRGVIALGKIESGTLMKGQTIMIMPTLKQVVVDSIQIGEMGDYIDVSTAKPGDNVYIKFKGVNDDDIRKGFVLVDKHSPSPVVERFQALVQIMELDKHMLFTPGYKAVMHLHTTSTDCTIDKIIQINEKSGSVIKNPSYAKSLQVCVCNISLSHKVVVEKFADYSQLGRFTIRDGNRTIAIGKITKLPKEAYKIIDSFKCS
jgi:peptide chain release factor subunit 3